MVTYRSPKRPKMSISVAAKTAPFPTSFQKPARLVLPALRVLFFARHIKSRNQKIIHRHEVCKKLYKSLKKDIYKALFLLRNSQDILPQFTCKGEIIWQSSQKCLEAKCFAQFEGQVEWVSLRFAELLFTIEQTNNLHTYKAIMVESYRLQGPCNSLQLTGAFLMIS